MPDELKDCPFCGSQQVGFDNTYNRIECDECGAQVKFWSLESELEYWDIAKAWNRRAEK